MNNYTLVRPLLVTVEHRAVTEAVAAYDAAVTARAEHRPPPERRKHAEVVLRAEHVAAVLEDRPPTLTAATLTAADEATIDDQLRTDALDEHVRRRMAALDAAVAAAGAHVWHALAKVRHDESTADAVEALWGQLQLPPLYAMPGLVLRGRFSLWYPPTLRQAGTMPGAAAEIATVHQQWDAHLWSELALAEGRGWRLEDDGTLRLLTPWPPAARMRPSLPDRAVYTPPNVHRTYLGGQPARSGFREGELVWVGRGPNGEPGATVDDIAGNHLQPADIQW